MKRKHGWKPDIPDKRDLVIHPQRRGSLPAVVDLRPLFFKVWNQGSLGACTGHAVGAALLFNDVFDNDMDIVIPSRRFLYYNGRLLEKNTANDDGACIRNVIKGAAKWGYPDEAEWKYSIKGFAEKPREKIYRHAKRQSIKRYERVRRRISDFKKILAGGLPIVIGVSVYESFESEKVTRTGQVPMPKYKREKLVGGHAILIVGYDETKKVFIFRNSWGKGWGDNGHGYLPYEFITDEGLSDDFWVIRR